MGKKPLMEANSGAIKIEPYNRAKGNPTPCTLPKPLQLHKLPCICLCETSKKGAFELYQKIKIANQ
jgi:hypothetical protein